MKNKNLIPSRFNLFIEDKNKNRLLLNNTYTGSTFVIDYDLKDKICNKILK